MTEKIQQQITIISKAGTITYTNPFELKQEKEEKGTNFEYSNKGEKIAILDELEIKIKNIITGKTEQELKQFSKPYKMEFSPLDNYLITYEKMTPDHQQNKKGNIAVWDLKKGKEVQRFTQINFNDKSKHFIFTEDEQLCARMDHNQIIFFTTENIHLNPIKTMGVKGIASFEFVSGKKLGQYFLLFFIKQKGMSSMFRICEYPRSQALYQQQLGSVDELDVKWSYDKEYLLVGSNSSVDQTDKNYFGSTKLFFLKSNGSFFAHVPLLEGPVYDYAFHPTRHEFIVISGFMPGKPFLYDEKCDQVYDFGNIHCNGVSFSPNGKYAVFTGFGNLSGEIHFWDIENFRLIRKNKAECSVLTKWSDCSNFLLTAVLFPQMKVDNEFRVFSHNGLAIKTIPADTIRKVDWKPLPKDQLDQVFTLSKENFDFLSLNQNSIQNENTPKNQNSQEKIIPKKVGKYVPPMLANKEVAKPKVELSTPHFIRPLSSFRPDQKNKDEKKTNQNQNEKINKNQNQSQNRNQQKKKKKKKKKPFRKNQPKQNMQRKPFSKK
ncbi:eukaryotic translation initiation factor 2a [Anaeramoeba ignava]|uniref:Eukaryotic translation initiation factor 2A n=1 Tax=Anaeramoeba ignava TaxID=1746090 RepID=A0A9Q0LDV1_ANAIG|nr:eukaryotic translation initiation factor 2a [Anaeramoeba ignava]